MCTKKFVSPIASYDDQLNTRILATGMPKSASILNRFTALTYTQAVRSLLINDNKGYLRKQLLEKIIKRHKNSTKYSNKSSKRINCANDSHILNKHTQW